MTLAVPAGSVAGYPVDHWVKIEERIYLIRERHPAANKIRVLPVAAAAIGERVRAADIITVRLDERPTPIERTPEFWGPLSFRWVEA